MHHDYDSLKWEDIGNGWQESVVNLAEGDSTWNPASTSRPRIYGPAKVTYQRTRSQVSAYVEDPVS